MNWTRKKRYLPYKSWDTETLMHLQAQAANSKQQMHYHLHPTSGLINDPNGFSYFNGEYHVFYQSYPFGPVHGLKSWIHFKSKDLVHWLNLGLALEPDTFADSHGAYSGSAKQIGNKLFLMYTGNHRDQNWVRTPYQIGAWMDSNGKVENKTVLFKNPTQITEHFRDPQISEQNGIYYAILGAQDVAKKNGHIDVWQSKDLKNWHENGFLNFSSEKMGYMIECPNLITVDGKSVLIFCPQGLNHKTAIYDNIYPNMYVIGDKIDLSKREMKNPSQLTNLDNGFDVYATQAFNAPDGKAYAISWVGLPDTKYPTDKENWANCLSQVKELSIKHNKLIQKPVKAMKELRFNKKNITADKLITENSGKQYELKLKIFSDQIGSLYLAANNDLTENLKLVFNTKMGQLTLDRSHAGKVAEKYGETRRIVLPAHQNLNLNIFIDNSLVEIFVNNGENVLTGRFFTSPNSQKVMFAQKTNYQGKYWQMKTIF